MNKLITLIAISVVALTGCEEAAPPTTQATAPTPPASPSPTEPASAPTTESVVITIAPDQSQRQEQIMGADTAIEKTITFPADFNAGRRYDTAEIIDQWYHFASKPINDLIKNHQVPRMQGISTDTGTSWYVESLEITPSLWMNVRIVVSDEEPDAYATVVINIYADVVVTPYDITTTAQDAATVVTDHLTHNTIQIRLLLYGTGSDG